MLASPKALYGMAAPFSSQDKAIPRSHLWVSWERTLHLPSWVVQCAVTHYTRVTGVGALPPILSLILPLTGFSASGGAAPKPLLE